MSPNVALVGAGLAGSLLAIYLAKRGFQVDVYERRPDMRRVDIGGGRSINLALSTRGIHALKEVGILDHVMKVAIPMKGRMIHSDTGELMFQRYGKDDSEVIYATSRSELNMALMNAAEQSPGVRLHFNRKCTGMDFRTGEVQIFDEANGAVVSVPTETVIGTDGSASALRMEMQRSTRFNFSQQFLEYGYKELTIPAAPDSSWLLERNALHIWPRRTFMLIALPNIDGSFTCTLFFPHEGETSFESLDSPGKVAAFFRQQFPDAVALMPDFLEQYVTNPTGAMVTVKCSPWHVDGRMALLGDAAHAIVPFFGQGMNCAFEDCTYLNQILEEETGDRRQETRGSGKEARDVPWGKIYRRFEELRKQNADAIADLAVENFVEMRDLVARPEFQLRKKVEQLLHARFPDRFIPKYSMVTFHRIPYFEALVKGRIQEGILQDLCAGVTDPSQVDWARAETLVMRELPP